MNRLPRLASSNIAKRAVYSRDLSAVPLGLSSSGLLAPVLDVLVDAWSLPKVMPRVKVEDLLARAISTNTEVVTTPLYDGVDVSPVSDVTDMSILHIKRTFQPSLVRRKRKHGFLARVRTRNGVRVLNRRRFKGRRKLCA